MVSFAARLLPPPFLYSSVAAHAHFVCAHEPYSRVEDNNYCGKRPLFDTWW